MLRHIAELLFSVLSKVVSHFVIKYLEKVEAEQLTKQSVSDSKDNK